MSDSTLVLVGNAKAGTISVLALRDSALEPLADNAVGAGCGTFAIDHARGLVYSAVKEPEPAVVTLDLDRATGVLVERSRTPIEDPLAYLALTRDGSLLLGASYHGGWGVTWPVRDGVVGDPVGRVEHRHIHCVVPDAAGRHAYWVALGDDLVAQTAISDAGDLLPLDPATVPVDEGAGPRHLVLAANERSAYLVTEFTGEVLRFDRDDATGVLVRAESVPVFDPDAGLSTSRLGADPMAEHLIWGADVHLAGFGRFLLATERTASTLGVVTLDPDGQLEGVIGLVQTEAQPRGFAVAPDNRHVVVAGERSGGVALYELSDEGVLTERGRRDTGAGANWARFA